MFGEKDEDIKELIEEEFLTSEEISSAYKISALDVELRYKNIKEKNGERDYDINYTKYLLY